MRWWDGGQHCLTTADIYVSCIGVVARRCKCIGMSEDERCGAEGGLPHHNRFGEPEEVLRVDIRPEFRRFSGGHYRETTRTSIAS